MRIIGLDPGLRKTGWGVIEAEGNRLTYVASGTLKIVTDALLADRLCDLDRQLTEILKTYTPDQAAVEEVFVNKNPQSTLKLGMARGVVMVAPAKLEIYVAEYTANQVKKSVVGTGHAAKGQVGMMVSRLLPKAPKMGEDEADALAVAITHAHFAMTHSAIQGRK